ADARQGRFAAIARFYGDCTFSHYISPSELLPL
ncbi:MAG: hypothetical protein ACI8VW_002277, partial [bacterium]